MSINSKFEAVSSIAVAPGGVAALPRVTFTIAEAALAMGMRPASLRRLIERHARAEGDETVARLSAGVVARKRRGFARWAVVIPSELRR
jgi:hypothetical protein